MSMPPVHMTSALAKVEVTRIGKTTSHNDPPNQSPVECHRYPTARTAGFPQKTGDIPTPATNAANTNPLRMDATGLGPF